MIAGWSERHGVKIVNSSCISIIADETNFASIMKLQNEIAEGANSRYKKAPIQALICSKLSITDKLGS